MLNSVYNLAIFDVAANSVHGAFRICLRNLLRFSAVVLALTTVSLAADWNTLEHNLAHKILAVTGPNSVTVSFENRSSLGKRDSDIIENGLRSAMQAAGLQLVASGDASASIAITLSENPTSYVWVAQIRPNSGDPAIAMVSMSRPEGSASRETVPLSLRKIPLYSQDQPILDVTVLEGASNPTRIAVLDPERVSFYRLQNGKWQPEQTLMITHNHPWPRDLRGRLIPGRDHSLTAYLPGVTCTTGGASGTSLDCRQSDDPWPLLPGDWNGTTAVFPSAGIGNRTSTVARQTMAFFAPSRNFFTGALTPAIGKFTTLPKFFSAAPLRRDGNILWLFAETDGHVHLIDGVSDQTANVSWGSDLAGVETSCGAGWQILAVGAGEGSGDTIRAYEFPDRDPVAVSPSIEFGGPVTALWTESHGDTAVAVSRNQETGTYEAFRLAMACGQ